MRITALLTLLATLSLNAQQDLLRQSDADARRKSEGCISAKCHVNTEPMHASPAVRLGCTDCHGGNASTTEKLKGHVLPRFAREWNYPSSANPERAYTLSLRESQEYVRFVNPGDLRAAPQTCGTSTCHKDTVYKVQHSLMTHGAFLWGAALYNNGGVPFKRPQFGESYGIDGLARKLFTTPTPTEEEMRTKGLIPFIQPLPQFEFTQPGNTLRVFERGDNRLSNRGFGTLTRTDPVFQGLQRTRLLDPLLSMLGTNDHPGDYRSSGCTACHVVYANDRNPVHSGPYAKHGNRGFTINADPTIPKNESGHPIQHRFTRSIPSSQCVVCHIHPGTSYAFQYLGYMWWDNETDGDAMYPAKSKQLTAEQEAKALARNPEAASLKGNWSDQEFLRNLTDLNPKLKQTQFADFHGHGWVYRAVFKHDRKGTLLDKDDKPVAHEDPQKFDKAVHLKDIHLEKGMHCTDCHFEQDAHGNGKLYGEARAAVEIECVDCHGTATTKASLKTSGPASPTPPHNLALLRTPFGAKRFEWSQDKLIQRSMVDADKQWIVSQVMDSLRPGSYNYNEKARLAKTIQKDNQTWGDTQGNLAHSNDKMSCYSCHTSWMTSCFGCHLTMKANAKRPQLHFNSDPDTRNFTSYNFQVLRDDVFMLGLDSTVKGNKIAPVRSSSAILVGSQNANREWLYSQQQTISAEGYSGQAFNPHFPHTVRTKETRTCTDCHVSQNNDNNAWMAQLLLQGTNFVNFMGRYIYIGEGKHGIEAAVVTERDEPQAVIGSYLHKLSYPENYAKFEKEGRQLHEHHHHHGEDVQSVQLRGEYLYAAKGKHGVEIYDVANIDNKAIAERIVSAPVSKLGQRFTVSTKDAAWIASPTTLGVDPARKRDPLNEEQPVHLLYAFLYVADRQEGLILINAATLLDGDPRNNFLKRTLTFNPDNALNGANHVVIAGRYAYVSCDKGFVIVDIDKPLTPKIISTIPMQGAGHAAIQFRYAFVLDSEGMKTIDITNPAAPAVKASLPLKDAKDIYVARTYAYIAAGHQGLAIVDIENPEKPAAPRFFNAAGKINDTHAVRVGMTNASVFAYLADGKNGLHVLQLTSPVKSSGMWGFSPALDPELIATFKTKGDAIALSKGLDRDRAVDESGNQVAVFGRRGARPFNEKEMQRLYLKDGKLYFVTDAPPGPPKGGK
ncbi:MAG: hypothetical protein JST93_23195 [Acidobacteria bacterium]|nr:hypothetical protein [Acidobacteriota bacterium]